MTDGSPHRDVYLVCLHADDTIEDHMEAICARAQGGATATKSFDCKGAMTGIANIARQYCNGTA